jgi:methylglutaconyl-CoA hydratase
VLPRLTNRAATELLLTGEPFDGPRAVQIGLVNAAVPAVELDATVDRYTASLLRGGPQALAGTKALLRRTGAARLREKLAELTELSVMYFLSPEGAEGAAAFREKRDASWMPKG